MKIAPPMAVRPVWIPVPRFGAANAPDDSQALTGSVYQNRSHQLDPGRLYDDFAKTPAGGLLELMQALKPPGRRKTTLSPIQIRYRKEHVQARYGLHLSSQWLVENNMDAVHQALAQPARMIKLKTVLQQPEVQKVLLYFYPREQYAALEALVENPDEFLGFAKNWDEPLFQHTLERAKDPKDRYHRLFYQPRVNLGSVNPPLINNFKRLYAMLRPTVQRQAGISPQISIGVHFPPKDSSRPGFSDMFSQARNLDTQEHLLQLAAGKHPANARHYNEVSKRWRHGGGKEITAFLNQHDPTGEKGSQMIESLMENRPFYTEADEKQYRETLQRFLLLASQWILPNPKVKPAKKYRDVSLLLASLNNQPEFLKTWRKMQRRYPLFPALNSHRLQRSKAMSVTQPAFTDTDKSFLDKVKTTFAQANLEFARSYYLFATARLEKTYNSSEIYAKYPLLQDENTFKRLKTLYDANPKDEEIKRLFVDALGTYISNTFSKESDEMTNLKNDLKIDVSGLDIKDKDGNVLTSVLYEDTSELFKRIPEKTKREALYQRMAEAYGREITPKFVDLFHKENKLLADLGYPDVVAFYSQSSGHNLLKLGEKARTLITETKAAYTPKMAEFYNKRTGESFENATRADIAFVFHGKSDDMAHIDQKFPQSKLVSLAQQTFDGMGLGFSQISETVDFATKEEYLKTVDQGDRPSRILLDVANREGKRSRAYVYPAQAPGEIYLSVKPEGGLDDYSAFFHESGHAQHFAYVSKELSFPMALMGNNTVTESYAYLMQNLFLNKHWLTNVAGLSGEEASQAIRRSALNDLYMLRRYASKMQFELKLFDGTSLEGKPRVYADLLTQGTGFKYDDEGWSRDVDHGFYVADYFTAWALEAQLREYLQSHFGSPQAQGEDWYKNPEAGNFLRGLWRDGNLTQAELSQRLGYNDPTDVKPLLSLMNQNLNR